MLVVTAMEAAVSHTEKRHVRRLDTAEQEVPTSALDGYSKP
jgi:hypothetical protein